MGILAYTLLLAVADTPSGPQILHEPVDCLVADAFPRLEARVEPDDDVARAVVRFRREGDSRWYSVTTFRREGVWAAVLPKPKAGSAPVHYVIEVTDKAAVKTSSKEFVAAVSPSAASCPGARVAAIAVSPPQISVEVPEGTRSLPEGFSGKNVSGSYPSGKPVKGKPKTALFGLAAAGAAAAGIAQLKSDPTARSTEPSLQLLQTLPNQVSVTFPFPFTLFIRANLELEVASGEVRVSLHPGAPDATPSCAFLSGRFQGLTSFVPKILTTSQFNLTGACTVPFTVSLARVVIVDDGGAERFRSGQSVPDLSVPLRFVP